MLNLARRIPDQRKANKIDAAAWFDVALPTIDAWIRRGCPVIQRGRQGTPWVIDLKEMHEWHLRQKWLGGAEDDGDSTDPEKLSPKDRLDWYRGNRERKKDMQEAGELVPAARFEAELAAVLKAVAVTLESLPDVLERDAGIDGAAVERTQAVIDRVREDLYQKLVNLEVA